MCCDAFVYTANVCAGWVALDAGMDLDNCECITFLAELIQTLLLIELERIGVSVFSRKWI